MITQLPVNITGNYTSNGEITYHWDEENALLLSSAMVADLSDLSYSTWTNQVESGIGTYTYTLENDNANFVFEGSIEVTAINYVGDVRPFRACVRAAFCCMQAFRS